jgi:hypothetical protein
VTWNASNVNNIPVPIKRELECFWCDKLKSFIGPLKIKGRVLKKFNMWSNMSEPRALDRYEFHAFLIW